MHTLSLLDPLYPQFNFRMIYTADGTVTVKLDRALYGCIESAIFRHNKLKMTLEEDGLTINKYDCYVLFTVNVCIKYVTIIQILLKCHL